jgi:acetyl/propionyl-CoA carboxylase alpha subunit
MAAKDKAAKAAAAAQHAKENPYLQRIIHDEELRDNMVVAFEAAKNAYGRLNNGKAPTKVLIEDKKLHADLKRSADALRDASAALREAPKSATPKKKAKRKGGVGRLLLVAIVGGVIAVAVSEGLRNKVLDALFGAEEEFDYTSNTTPAAPPAEAAPAT